MFGVYVYTRICIYFKGKFTFDRRLRRMTEDSIGVTDESYDSYDDTYDRPLERWAPLGAANVSPPASNSESR